MSQALAIIEPLPLPTRRQLTPVLPAWVTDLESALCDKWGCAYHPLNNREWMLRKLPTTEQRAALENNRSALVKMLDQTPERSQEAEDRVLDAVTELMLAKAHSANTDPVVGKAKLKSFIYALEEIPVWATELAVKNWHRGKCDVRNYVNPDFNVAHDYRWAPDPVDLARIAERYVKQVRDRITTFNDILNAKLFIEPSAERRAAWAAEERKAIRHVDSSDGWSQIGEKLFGNVDTETKARA